MSEKIKGISAIKILNSRGEETIKVKVKSENHEASFAVPQGKSAGYHEAISLSSDAAINKIKEVIAPIIIGMEVDFQKIDKVLIEKDGTAQKKSLGANAILGTSIAVAKLQAKIEKKLLFDFLSQFFKEQKGNFHLLMNLINGGVHSFNGPPFQEYLIVLKGNTFAESIFLGARIYKEIGDALKTNIGDEGGYVPMERDVEFPLRLFTQIIQDKGFDKNKVSIGIDIAATQFFQDNCYLIGDKEFTNTELKNFYLEILKKYNIEYLEDPFFEDDFEDFSLLKKECSNCLIVGDDLTVTNTVHLKQAIEQESISGLIIKPNQIGTLSETIDTIKLAKENNIEVIVSHRSGDTNDFFISDLAVACGAWGLKSGAPARGERIAKYNRLLEIEEIKNAKNK